MKSSPTVAASWMSAADLSRVLGGPVDSHPPAFDDGDVWPVVQVRLAPGDVLYQQGSRSAYGYIVSSGVIQCTRSARGQSQRADAVTHVGAHDLLGVQTGAGGRTETACALTAVELMALPAEAWVACSAASGLVGESVARPVGQALMRDLRTVYRLRDLPPYARVVAGLHHLVDLMRRGEGTLDRSEVPVSIEVETLALWLDLPREDLAIDLSRLQRYGALRQHGDVVTALSPEVIDMVADALPKASTVRHVPARSASVLASAAVLMLAVLCTLLVPAPALAALQAAGTSSGAEVLAGEVPWGFVCFSGAVLLASHLRPARRR